MIFNDEIFNLKVALHNHRASAIQRKDIDNKVLLALVYGCNPFSDDMIEEQ